MSKDKKSIPNPVGKKAPSDYQSGKSSTAKIEPLSLNKKKNNDKRNNGNEGEHVNKHQSRSQHKNHVLAFFSCYFFGYHYEHHDAPWLPWWKLWRAL